MALENPPIDLIGDTSTQLMVDVFQPVIRQVFQGLPPGCVEPKIRGFYPQIIHLFIGFSIIFTKTIHFWCFFSPIFRLTPT